MHSSVAELFGLYRASTKQDRKQIRMMAARKNNDIIISLSVTVTLITLFFLPADYFLFRSSARSFNICCRTANIIYSAVSLYSFIVNFVLRKKTDRWYILLNFTTYLYSFATTAWGGAIAYFQTAESGRPEITIYFICLFVIASVFYLNSLILLPLIAASSAVFFTMLHLNLGIPSDQLYMPELFGFTLAGILADLIRNASLIHEFKLKRQISGYLQELEDARIEADNANAAKSSFLATMSHEIRTPMNAIIGLTEMTLRLDVPARAREYLRQVKSAGRSLLTIINDVLDFSKIESGRLDIISDDYDIAALLADTDSLVKVRIGNKPVALEMYIDPGIPHLLHGDEVRIKQILLNLAGNAAKFTENGHIAVKTGFIPSENGKITLTIRVEDTGSGIKPEDLAKLFKSFSQVDKAKNHKKEGTGLGLAISKRLTELMGGTIGVESEYGKGSCFHFEIPQTVTESASVASLYSSAFSGASSGTLFLLDMDLLQHDAEFVRKFDTAEDTSSEIIIPSAEILVVDDNGVNLQVARGLLEPYKCRVDEVSTGLLAIKAVQQKQYDIVFLDHMMPDMDGIETEQRIRHLTEGEDGSPFIQPVIIALTANAAGGAKDLFLSNGFDGFLAKPIDVAELDICLRKYIPAAKQQKTDLSEAAQKHSGQAPVIASLDTESGIKNTGSAANFDSVLHTYLAAMDETAEKISSFAADAAAGKNGALHEYTILVHALKSSSRIIGASELSALAARLEQCGNKGDTAAVVSETPKLLSMYRALEQPVASYFREKEKNAAPLLPEMNSTEFNTLLSEIRSAVAKNSLEGAEKALAEIKKHDISGPHQKLVADLSEAVENIDFDTCSALLKDTVH